MRSVELLSEGDGVTSWRVRGWSELSQDHCAVPPVLETVGSVLVFYDFMYPALCPVRPFTQEGITGTYLLETGSVDARMPELVLVTTDGLQIQDVTTTIVRRRGEEDHWETLIFCDILFGGETTPYRVYFRWGECHRGAFVGMHGRPSDHAGFAVPPLLDIIDDRVKIDAIQRFIVPDVHGLTDIVINFCTPAQAVYAFGNAGSLRSERVALHHVWLSQETKLRIIDGYGSEEDYASVVTQTLNK